MDPIVLDIGAQPQCFVDDAVVAASRGLERRVHSLVKAGAEPVLAASEPWEGDWTGPVAVHFDRQLGLWRMWYNSTGKRRMDLPALRRGTLHVAVSPDGVRWEKPPLGACDLGGGPNNLCVWEDGRPMTGAVTVFDEPGDPDPSRRYKLIWYGPNYYLAYSADGIRWRPAQRDPVWANGAGDGLEETAFFFRDPLAGKYRGHMRVWRRHQTIRKTGLGESDDLLTWTGPVINWEASPDYGLGAQMYGMHVHVDAGLYWAFPWIFYTAEPFDEALQYTMRFKLGWSRDGRAWNAIAPEQDMVPMGERGRSFDWGMMFSHCPAVLTETEGRLYYIGCDGIHDGSDRVRAVGLATWRRGGLVSLHAEQEGTLLTHHLLFRGQEIRINARTAAGGSIQAELLGDGGGMIKSHNFAASDAFQGDAQDHVLTWNGSGDLSRFYGQMILLRLRLRRADLFSFRIAGSKERFEMPLGPPPVRAGRCVEAPAIDGVLDETCWEDYNHSGVAADFVRYDRIEPVAVKTRALFTYDDRNLYIAVECNEPLSESLPALRAAGPVNYHKEECFEIRLSGPAHGCGLHYHQLFVTSTGGMEHNYFSKEAGDLRGYLRDPWQVKTSVVPGRWCAEIAVPFATLTTAAPAAGERWRLNIIRHRHAGGEDTSCWVCQFGSVHRTDLAGDLVFG